MTPSPALSTIRPAEPTDIPSILRLVLGLAEYEGLAHEATVTEKNLREALFIPHPRVYAILADVADRAVGLALFYYTFSSFKARANIFLEDLFVESTHRGTGIGLALMRHLARRAVAEHCGRIEWRVLDWNEPSIRFYERLGAGRMHGWHPRQLGGEALVALAEGTSYG